MFKKSSDYIIFIDRRFRCLATAAKPKSSEKLEKAAAVNQSFVQNFFLGNVESAEVFPYPYYLNEEQTEMLAMVVGPVERFFTVSKILVAHYDNR